jgi:ribosomal protein L12E/L44/L45/RPP1/RPP2
VVMVGLIIFFPGIVSSGLDKVQKIDLDKVILQVQEEPAAAAPAPGSDAEKAEEQKRADEDPMKAMQDSMAKEKK